MMADDQQRLSDYQVESSRLIAMQQITATLETFARQLPNGQNYLQEAINAAGALLDHLLRQTGEYDEGAVYQPASPPNPDLAAHREAIGHTGEGEEIHDVTSGA